MGGSAGGDCSDRSCPYELAWVDTPDRDGKTHQYAECAARGICDREAGECDCLGGFEGKACARQTCPDSCSGHGTCEFMNELTFGTVFNDYFDGTDVQLPTGTAASFPKNGLGVGAVRPDTMGADDWDADRARACVCDAGWTGINCASRMCPTGNDVMACSLSSSGTVTSQVQKITLMSGGTDGGKSSNFGVVGPDSGTGSVPVYDAASDQYAALHGADSEGYMDFLGQSFALRFTSLTNETFSTVPVMLEHASTDDTAATLLDTSPNRAVGQLDLNLDITNALLGLPNHVINGVTVTTRQFRADDGKGLEILVTFTGDSVQGQQNLLEVITSSCGDGCTPKVNGLKLVTNTNVTSSVTESTVAGFAAYECGRRGKCDYDTGMCSCFEGYTGQACTSLTALV